jgi:hypothetical protein
MHSMNPGKAIGSRTFCALTCENKEGRAIAQEVSSPDFHLGAPASLAGEPVWSLWWTK